MWNDYLWYCLGDKRQNNQFLFTWTPVHLEYWKVWMTEMDGNYQQRQEVFKTLNMLREEIVIVFYFILSFCSIRPLLEYTWIFDRPKAQNKVKQVCRNLHHQFGLINSSSTITKFQPGGVVIILHYKHWTHKICWCTCQDSVISAFNII